MTRFGNWRRRASSQRLRAARENTAIRAHVTEAALDGLIVVELGTGVATALAARTMAGFGAEVLKIEPPQGDPMRGVGPFPLGRANPETSAAFLYFHGGKSSVVLDLSFPPGRSVLARILGAADILLTDVSLADRQALDIDEKRLAQLAPQLIVVSVSPYGESGPHAEYQASDLTMIAAGGQMSLMGSPDREPVKPYGDQAGCQAALSVVGATMAAVFRRLRSGRASYVELSVQELQASAMDMQGPMAYNGDPQYPGYGRRIGNSTHSTWSYYRSKDGYVGVFVNPMNVTAFLRALGRPDLEDRMSDKAFHEGELRIIVERWCAERTCQEVYQAAVDFGAPFSYVATPENLLADAVIAQTGIWSEVQHTAAGTFRVPGAPFQVESEYTLRAAPLLGEQTVAVLERFANPGDDSALGAGVEQALAEPMTGWRDES